MKANRGLVYHFSIRDSIWNSPISERLESFLAGLILAGIIIALSI